MCAQLGELTFVFYLGSEQSSSCTCNPEPHSFFTISERKPQAYPPAVAYWVHLRSAVAWPTGSSRTLRTRWCVLLLFSLSSPPATVRFGLLSPARPAGLPRRR